MKEHVIYGVKSINGKQIATIYPDVQSVPEDEVVKFDYELQDYLEQKYKGK